MELLAGVRAWKGLTQKELAKKAGTSVTTISRLENGHHGARMSLVMRMAEALDVPVESLTGGKGKEND